jgi:hypothetical protein
MIVLKEVDRDPFGAHAEIYRSTVDQAIALCTTEGGISGSEGGCIMLRPLTEGGQEAWNFIKRFRCVAWTKAGLDSDVVMTREEVVRLISGRVGHVMPSQMNDLLLPLDGTEGTLEGGHMHLSWDEWDSVFGNFEFQSL